ncbi:nucleotidyltransferase family protein [archaeon]|jgi:uncharacterized protein|nr:nucleotidyltransferase family protein [archaeon]MBT4373249.1 nucleotidyltransferase family protein [archaeon]MBT4531594.1 nucleotidyltransferase family protein [archaeon]MBT7001228.1 nucleotidyltransferase family protein [archaeon]MBT7282286.1 nucleotidyltransferase family protein [archaeon]
MNNKISAIKKKVIPTLKKYNVKRAGIFGSYARGNENKKSDIDILVEIGDKNFSLFDLIRLKLYLEKKLEKKVDLVEYSSIHPLIKEEALKEEVRII